MVKGAARRAVIVRPADTQHFEQAIFIVAESEKGGMTQGQLLQEAQRLTGCYPLHKNSSASKSLRPLPRYGFCRGIVDAGHDAFLKNRSNEWFWPS